MNTQIYEEACTWFVDLRAGDVDAAGRKRFDAWIRKSPEHLRAYLEITELWQDASQLKFGDESDVEALLAQAGAEEPQNVVSLEAAAGRAPRAAAIARPRRSIRRFAVAASLVLALVATAFFAWQEFYRTPVYYTSIGEQRIISLEDGSLVKLNTRSRIRVKLTERGRDIDLLQGQALFQVAKDASRPFTVRVDDLKVRAVGTQFDVYRKESGATITVIEGQVVVGSNLPEIAEVGSAPNMPVVGAAGAEPTGAAGSVPVASARGAGAYLSAGQQVTISFNANEPITPQPASIETTTAWTQNKLVFRASSLPEVATEFNRYNRRQLVVADTQLASFRISGVYSSTDPSLLLTFLREQPGIHVEETGDSIIITQQK